MDQSRLPDDLFNLSNSRLNIPRIGNVKQEDVSTQGLLDGRDLVYGVSESQMLGITESQWEETDSIVNGGSQSQFGTQMLEITESQIQQITESQWEGTDSILNEASQIQQITESQWEGTDSIVKEASQIQETDFIANQEAPLDENIDGNLHYNAAPVQKKNENYRPIRRKAVNPPRCTQCDKNKPVYDQETKLCRACYGEKNGGQKKSVCPGCVRFRYTYHKDMCKQCYLKSKLRCQKCCDGLKLDENRCVECGRISVYPIRRDSKNIGPSTSRQ